MALDIFISVNYCIDFSLQIVTSEAQSCQYLLADKGLRKGGGGRKGVISILFKDQHMLLKRKNKQKKPIYLFLVHKSAPIEYKNVLHYITGEKDRVPWAISACVIVKARASFKI